MIELKASRLKSFAGEIIPGLAGIGLITVICFPAHRLVIPTLIYLLAVALQSLRGGFGSAVLVSVAASACLEYFFIPPVQEWRIDDPEDGVALLVYLITSLVLTRLALKARDQARIAERKRRDASLLYETASRLLSLGPETAAGPECVRIFREVFAMKAVCLFDTGAAAMEVEGGSAHDLDRKTREAGIRGGDYQDADCGLYVRCLRAGGTIIGAVGYEGHFDDPSIALPLSVLAAASLERMRSFRSAARALATAQAEMLRSAILDAFAHEFKTPLAIILAAAGGLREISAPQCEQTEMTDIIERQTLRLKQLTTRLLRTARLEQDDVSPHLEPVRLDFLLNRVIDQYRLQFGRTISVRSGSEVMVTMADPELLTLAITQLVDNACKYSPPGSPVLVELDAQHGFAQLRVTNEGNSIRPEERDRIFERFYRGSAADQAAPGSGLGLYVARKIVRAHGGFIELESDYSVPATTSFRTTLPAVESAPSEQEDEYEACEGIGSRR